MESFENKEIIFYTLILNEKEIQKIQESPEILEDFLEDKICSLLNLNRECEYFSRFFTQDSMTYYCLLLSKESLKGYVKDSKTYLSHPCFLCAQFLQDNDAKSQAFLVLDSYTKWTLICFLGKEIIFLQPIKDIKTAQEKIEFLSQKPNFCLTLWLSSPIKAQEKQDIEVLQARFAKFGAQILFYPLEEVSLLESFNFNPLEKTLPLSEQKISKALKFGAVGALVGIVVWFVLLAFCWLENKEINTLKAQIEQQQIKINHQNQNYTRSQKQALLLQEKLESLQAIYDKNLQFLKSTSSTTQLIPFFNSFNPLLQKHNVKIAYFGLEERDSLNLLLRGENVLQILEDLEKSHLGSVQNLKKYQDFYWIQVSFGDLK